MTCNSMGQLLKRRILSCRNQQALIVFLARPIFERQAFPRCGPYLVLLSHNDRLKGPDFFKVKGRASSGQICSFNFAFIQANNINIPVMKSDTGRLSVFADLCLTFKCSFLSDSQRVDFKAIMDDIAIINRVPVFIHQIGCVEFSYNRIF